MSDSSALAKPQELIEWLRANGGHFHPSAELKVDPQFGLSVFSTAPIKADERLVSCPFELAITAQVASKAVAQVTGIKEDEMVWPAGSSKEGEKWNERMRIGAYLELHWVYKEKSDALWPSTLAHKVYLDSLPSPSDLTTPLYFNDSELELLKGSNLLGAVEDRKREWKAESDAVRAVLKEDELTWDRYLAIATYMSSRSFPSKLLRIPKGEKTETHPTGAADGKVEEEVSQPVLLPGVDIFNHARNQPILWLSSHTPSTTSSDSATTIPSISLVSTKETESGVQLFNNYGAKPNEEWLLGYGFVIPSNPDDTVNLRLGTANLPEHVNKRLAEKGLDASKRFELRRDGEIDKELLEVVRIMLNDSPHSHDHDHEEEIDEEDEHALHAHEEEEMQLELDVLGMLGGMLDDKLKKLQGNEGESEIKTAGGGSDKDLREQVKDMCKIYRHGQIDILNAAMDKLSERIERIEKLLDEGMGGCPCGC
ncbi:hypothetical protein IAT40_005549 [Kwoniella sp. CBS 6097]